MKFKEPCRICDGWHWCGRPCWNNPERLASGIALNTPMPLPPKIETPTLVVMPIRVSKAVSKTAAVSNPVSKAVSSEPVDKAQKRRAYMRELMREKRAAAKEG